MNNKQETGKLVASILRAYVSKKMDYFGLLHLDDTHDYQSALIDMHKEAEMLDPTIFEEEE